MSLKEEKEQMLIEESQEEAFFHPYIHQGPGGSPQTEQVYSPEGVPESAENDQLQQGGLRRHDGRPQEAQIEGIHCQVQGAG